MINLKRI